MVVYIFEKIKSDAKEAAKKLRIVILIWVQKMETKTESFSDESKEPMNPKDIAGHKPTSV